MEVVLSGSGTSSLDSFASVTDLYTGSHSHTFKLTSSSRNGTACRADQVWAAQNDKALVHVFRWHKETVDQKIIIPEKLSSIAFSPDGRWLLGGSESGKIYLWELSSGNLVFVKDTHYQAVVTCQFTSDTKLFVTGSKDATAQVWSMASIFHPYSRQESAKPLYKLTQHNLAITQVHIGFGSSLQARLFTASEDHAIKIWDLLSGALVTTILFPSAVTCMVVDVAERIVYAGTDSGLIHTCRLYKKEQSAYAIGGMGGIVDSSREDRDTFSGHESPISALSISLDGSFLVSGAQDGATFVWDITTKQLSRKLKQQPSAVTTLLTIVRPSTQINGGATTTTTTSSKSQHGPVQLLKRAQVQRDHEAHTLHLSLSSQSPAPRWAQSGLVSDLDAVKIGLSRFSQPVTHDAAAHETIVRLKDEMSKMYGAYQDLKTRHEQLEKDYITSQI